MKFNFTAKVVNGKPKISRRGDFDEAIKSFDGKDIVISIEKKKSKRSLEQNNLWWLYMTILSKELGYTKEEIHEICKMKFNKVEKVDEKTGEIFEYLRSTTDLSKSEFADMISELIRWSAETFSIILPLPNEQLTIEA